MSVDDYDIDVIVVGGGIHGVSVAQAVVAAGYSVLLSEKSEIGSGTSSKSSKLIHGGLRYLESMQFSLVRSCLKERALLLKNAPELVKLVAFYIPVYKTTQRRPWQIAIGLHLYNLLSGFNSPFSKLAKTDWANLDSLSLENLEAVFQYYDAQTDDVQLTRAVAKSAQSLGADVLTNSTVTHCQINEDDCVVDIMQSGSSKRYRCRVLVNATGANVNDFLKSCSPAQKGLEIDLVQGAHILLNTPAKKGVYYLESKSDQRAVFAMPWGDKTLVGTTETKIEDCHSVPAPFPHEIEDLLSVYNDYFRNDKMSSKDVVESFAGLRVLPRETSSVFSRARDTVFLVDSESNPRILSMYGGKLTAYRATADKVLKKISSSLPDYRRAKTSTENLDLTI